MLGGWWRWELVSLDGVAPGQMVRASASVNLPLHHKVHKFSSGTGSPGWSGKKDRKMVVVVVVVVLMLLVFICECVFRIKALRRSELVLLLQTVRLVMQLLLNVVSAIRIDADAANVDYELMSDGSVMVID